MHASDSDHSFVGCMTMWVAAAFLLFVSASSSRVTVVDKEIQAIVDSLFAPDLFHRFLTIHPPNSSISPCDNFYRHVCPVDLPVQHAFHKILEKQITILENVQALNFQEDLNYSGLWALCKDLINELRQREGTKIDVVKTSKQIHDRCHNHGGRTCILRMIDKIIPIANDAAERYDIYPSKYVTPALNRLYTKFNTTEDLSTDVLLKFAVEIMKIFYSSSLSHALKDVPEAMIRLAFLSFMKRGGMMNEKFATQEEEITAEIRKEVARDAMRYSWSYDESRFGVVTGALIGIHLRNGVSSFLPMDHYELQDERVRPWKELLNSFHFADQIIGTPVAYVNRMAVFLARALRLTAEENRRISDFENVNAFADPETYSISFSHTLVLRLLHNVPDAIKYGTFYFTYGHESQHQVQYMIQSKIENDELHANRTKCLGTYMNDICHASMFKEEICNSGERTYREDDADQVGGRIALRLFRKHHHATLQEKPYPDVNLTNEQLFFAAQTIVKCTHTEQQKTNMFRDKRDVHSELYVRPNAVFAIMNEFREAFKCPPDSKMVQQIPFFAEREDYGRYSEVPIDACNPEISGWNYVRPAAIS